MPIKSNIFVAKTSKTGEFCDINGIRVRVFERTTTFRDSVWKTPLYECPVCGEKYGVGLLQHINIQARLETYNDFMKLKRGLGHANLFRKNGKIVKVEHKKREWN